MFTRQLNSFLLPLNATANGRVQRPLGIAFASLLLVLVQAQPAVAQVYKWVDDKGVVHYTETLPPEAVKKPSSQLNSQGRATKRTEGQLTPEQVAARDAETARKLEADRKIAERKRLDQMLVATYTLEQDFKIAYDRSANAFDARMLSQRERIKALEEREAKIADEMEFYKAGKKKGNQQTKQVVVPPQLIADQARIAKEKANIEKELINTETELINLKKRSDDDLARWTALKNGLPSGSPDVPKGAEKPDKTSEKK